MNSVFAEHPEHVSITVTNKCPMKCVMCPHSFVENDKFDEIDIDPLKFHNVIKNSKHTGLHGNGEPLVFDRIFDYIPDDLPQSCFLGFNTSGQFMSEDKINKIIQKRVGWILFSIDAGTQETYKKIRGASWNRLWDNINKLIELKEDRIRPVLYANMIIMNSNIYEVPILTQKLAELKAFEYLLIYHMNNNEQYPEVSWNDNSGNFIYKEELDICREVEDKYINEAIDISREYNFMLVANGRFLGNIYHHEQM